MLVGVLLRPRLLASVAGFLLLGVVDAAADFLSAVGTIEVMGCLCIDDTAFLMLLYRALKGEMMKPIMVLKTLITVL